MIIPFDDSDVECLLLLDQLYIDARYPGEFGLLPDGKPSLDEAKVFFTFAGKVYNKVKEIVESE